MHVDDMTRRGSHPSIIPCLLKSYNFLDGNGAIRSIRIDPMTPSPVEDLRVPS